MAVAAIVSAVWCVPSAAGPRKDDRQRDNRKADYIYLEALNQNMAGNSDAYMELVDYAYKLNPDDKYLGMEYGIKELYEAGDDSAAIEKGLDRINDYIKSNPSDLYGAVNYASLASQLGRFDRALEAWKNLYERNRDRVEVAGMYSDALTKTEDPENLRLALRIYDDIEATEGVGPNTATRKMRIYNMLHDSLAIKREMRRLMASSPRSAEYATLAGDLFHQLGDNDSALVYYNRGVELDPTNGAAYYHRALFYEDIGDSARYDSEVFRALQLPDLELEPKLGMLYDYVSKLYADTLQQPRIEKLFQSLITQYPHEASVRNLYGDYLVTVNKYAPAAEQISYAVDTDPTDVKRWQLLGSLYFTGKEYPKVISTVNSALRYHPSAVELYAMAAAAESQMKNSEKALEYLNRALLEVDSVNTDALSNINTSIGDTYYTKGNKDTAFVFYEKALEYNPDNLVALNNCAYYMACEGRDLDRALKMIERVVKENPESSTSLDTYAWVLFKQKKYAEAREAIDGAIANDDDPDNSADMLEHAGDIYFMDGNPDKALEFWRKALKLSPDNELLHRKVKQKTFFYK